MRRWRAELGGLKCRSSENTAWIVVRIMRLQQDRAAIEAALGQNGRRKLDRQRLAFPDADGLELRHRIAVDDLLALVFTLLDLDGRMFAEIGDDNIGLVDAGNRTVADID